MTKGLFSILTKLAIVGSLSSLKQIPFINIDPILIQNSEESYRHTSNLIHEAFKEYGIFMGVCTQCQFNLSDGLQASMQLFSTTLTEKKNVLLNDAESFGRGYIPFGLESGLSEYFECKEGFSYGYPSKLMSTRQLSAENKWPISLIDSDREKLNDLFLAKSLIAESILQAVWTILLDGQNNQKMTFQDLADEGRTISLMRLFHYYPTGKTLEDKTLGSSPHTDWGLLTVISDNSVSGLQILYENEWVDVTVPATSESESSNVFVVNAGDCLAALSSHIYRSPVHRVLSPSIDESDRYSAVYFFYPNYDLPMSLFQSPSKSSVIGEQCSDSDGEERSGPDSDAFNTLLQAPKAIQVVNFENICFGDYIVAKWRGVQKYN